MTVDASLERDLGFLTVEDLARDPYPLYERLRTEAPVAYIPAAGGWTATGYEAVKRVHEDTDYFMPALPAEPLECLGPHNILSLEGPQHRRYRKALHMSLSRPAVEGYAETTIGEVVDRQLGLLEDQGSGDLVAEYFEPISVLSLGRVIGIPDVDAETLRKWFRGIIMGSSNVTMDMDTAVAANAVSREIDDRLLEVFHRVNVEPNDTLISNLLERAEGSTLEERIRDITPTLKVVLGGGLQEPGHGASTLAAGLLGHSDLKERFVKDAAALIRPAAEEALRWVSPIQVNVRRVRVDVDLEGHHLPAGTYVNASVGSANRDEHVFGSDASRFNFDRRLNSHLAFGIGTHFCSGNNFGRAAINMSVQRLFQKFPKIQLDETHGEVEFTGFVFRAPSAIHVTLE